eukprot:TRINITY_DN42422_c0_g1_i1.p1 TRINITY_DN42422_c0_g1~~TRINITY_DN42422_c0_g1_i1.p1  ORF type:complete len:724 (-),score=109.31 TRINITY_DN42422_c0_g1_i1:490-2661(-)
MLPKATTMMHLCETISESCWLKRFQFVFAALVAMLTLVMLVLSSVNFGKCKTKELLSGNSTVPYAVELAVSMLGLLLVMPGTVWLLAMASTAYLRGVAAYAALIWAGCAFELVSSWVSCSQDFNVWNLLSQLVTSEAYVLSLVLLLSCVKAIESAALHHDAQRPLWLSLSIFMASMLVMTVCAVLWRLGKPVGFRENPWILTLLYVGMYFGCFSLTLFVWKAIQTLRRAALLAREAAQNATGLRKVHAELAALTLRHRCWGFAANITTSLAMAACVVCATFWGKCLELAYCRLVLGCLDTTLNIFTALAFSGAFEGALSARKSAKKEQARRLKWQRTSANWKLHPERKWQEKVEELASRGFTLRALLRFYRGLGAGYMPGYSPSISTTSDVVRRAIIPLSAGHQCSMAEVMMDFQCKTPMRMVTHSWNNRFADLIAAIVADALGEAEWDMLAYVLVRDVDMLEAWLDAAGVIDMSYWVCAFSVNQHAGICGDNPCNSRDSVTGQVHAVCNCGMAPCRNDTPPLLPDGRSINCEMNKFDEMMGYLSARDSSFAQIIAVDASFSLFSRAWCVAEIHAAHQNGMYQTMSIESRGALQANEEKLKELRIQNMQASRPEDIVEILSKIDDKDLFNKAVQDLLFSELLLNWKELDAATLMGHFGRLIRYQDFARSQRSLGVWRAGTQQSKARTLGQTLGLSGSAKDVTEQSHHPSKRAEEEEDADDGQV